MEEFWVRLLSILILLHQSGSTSDTTELTGALGGSVTFCSNNTATNGSGAFWNFGNKAIVVVPFKDPSQPLYSEDKFKSRFSVSERGRALTISQLTMEDAGIYSVTIGGKISTFTLQVLRELAEPRVSCEPQNCSSGRSCLFSLRCSVPGAGFGNVSYSWRTRGWVWEGQSMALALNRSSLEELGPLTCTARNGVSSRNVTLSTPGGLCSEISTHPPSPGSHLGSFFGIMAGVVAALLFSIFLIFFCKSRGWRKFHLSKSEPTDPAPPSEYTTVYAEVGASQQRVPKPNPVGGDPSTTIYSLVKRPEQAGDGAEENGAVTGLELV